MIRSNDKLPSIANLESFHEWISSLESAESYSAHQYLNLVVDAFGGDPIQTPRSTKFYGYIQPFLNAADLAFGRIASHWSAPQVNNWFSMEELDSEVITPGYFIALEGKRKTLASLRNR